MATQVYRSRGVCFLGWAVLASNVLLFFVFYFNFLDLSSVLLQRVIAFVSMTAVFPYDLFLGYFSSQWLPQICWVLMVVMCAFGILLLNTFASSIFIILNILHLVTLGYLVFGRLGEPGFLDDFFRLYFTAVVSGSYMIFLTLPEVRAQFKIDIEKFKLHILLNKPLGKEVRPSDAQKYVGLSVAYMHLERYDDAVDALQKAIQGDSEKAEYYFRLGMVRIRQGLASEAIQALKEAIQKDPLHYEAYYNLGIIYVQQGCSQEAAEMFLKATHVRPEESQAYRDLGDAYFQLGEFQDAVEQFRKAILLSHKDVYSYYRLGCILTEYLGEHQQAMEALRTAVKLQKNFCDAYFQLGKVFIKMKRYKDAVRVFKEVVRLVEDHVQGHYYLGFSYLMLEDFGSARRQCNFLRKHDADLARTLEILLSS